MTSNIIHNHLYVVNNVSGSPHYTPLRNDMLSVNQHGN
jgi:hypothetical protein